VPKPGWPLASLFVAAALILSLMRFAPDTNLIGDSIESLWVPSIIVAVVAVVRQLR
jgi:hypothetical protein